MKSLEQVKKYLEVEGINQNDCHKVIGFLYAEGDFALGTGLKFRVTANTFSNFVNWYEDEGTNIDGLIDCKDEIFSLWSKIKDEVGKVLNTKYNEEFDLRTHCDNVLKCHEFLDTITDNLCRLQGMLEEMEDNEKEEISE